MKEVDIKQGRKATVIFVPYRAWKAVKKVQGRLIREMEKKLSKRHSSSRRSVRSSTRPSAAVGWPSARVRAPSRRFMRRSSRTSAGRPKSLESARAAASTGRSC